MKVSKEVLEFYKKFNSKEEAEDYSRYILRLSRLGLKDPLLLELDTFIAEKTEKKHKTKYHLVPFSFIAKMADNMEKGLKNGRKEGDWVKLEASPENIDLYTDKLIRHLVSGDYAAVACNAMILDHLVDKPIFSEEE